MTQVPLRCVFFISPPAPGTPRTGQPTGSCICAPGPWPKSTPVGIPSGRMAEPQVLLLYSRRALHTLLLAHSTFLMRTAVEFGGGALGSHCQGDHTRGQSALILLPVGHLESEGGPPGCPGQPYWPYLSAGTETHHGLSPWPCLKVFPEQTVSWNWEPEGGRKDSLCIRSPGPGSPPEAVGAGLCLTRPGQGSPRVRLRAWRSQETWSHPNSTSPSRQPQHTPNLSESVFCLSNVGGGWARPPGSAAGPYLLVWRGQGRAGGPALGSVVPRVPYYVLEWGWGAQPKRHSSQA